MSDLIYEHKNPDGSELRITADIDGVVIQVRGSVSVHNGMEMPASWSAAMPLAIEQAEVLQLCLEKYIVDAARSSMRAALAMHLASQQDKPKDCGGECGSCGSCGHG